MHDNSNNYLQILSQLAKEYQQKYAELEQVCQEAQPDSVLQQLTARAELTTDHFRAAQQALFASLEQNQQQQNEYITQAATTISLYL